MKALKFFLLSIMVLMPVSGCHSASSTTPPSALAPGYSSAADQQMSQILSGARSFYSTIQCETKGMSWNQSASQCMTDATIASPLVLSSTEKATFNDFGKSLNLAETIYIAFHNGTATQQAAQDQVNIVQSEQDELPALAVTK